MMNGHPIYFNESGGFVAPSTLPESGGFVAPSSVPAKGGCSCAPGGFPSAWPAAHSGGIPPWLVWTAAGVGGLILAGAAWRLITGRKIAG